MADLAPARRPQGSYLAVGIGRKIVEVHKALFAVLVEGIDDLRVVKRAKRERGQDLRLASHEEAGTVHSRKQADLAGNRAYLVLRPAVRPGSLAQYHPADVPFEQLFEDLVDLSFVLGILLDQRRRQIGFQQIDRTRLAALRTRVTNRLLDLRLNPGIDLIHKLRIGPEKRNLCLGLAGKLHKPPDPLDLLVDGGVRDVHGGH